ncbi:flagellar motor protein MotB [Stomatohabitans albus]|uniref:flagellar motor protein MotB n=1 Tax=Stomatohabitans albus TaxID=3110766 RepID=UPI00300C8F40
MAKRHECPPPPKRTDAWMGTYGDMVTLLMAFFVMLFAMSSTDVTKFQALLSGLAMPFGNTAYFDGTTGSANGEPQIIERLGDNGKSEESHDSDKDQSNQQNSNDVMDGQNSILENGQTPAEQLMQVERELQSDVAGKLQELNLDGLSADIRDDARGLVIDLDTDNVLFQTGSSTLTKAGEELIASIAPELIETPNTIVIEGHTDNQPFSGGSYDNWNLAADRSVSVLKALVKNGLPPERVSATSYGESRPKVPNDSPEGQRANRRVEVLLVSLDQTTGPQEPKASPAPPKDIRPQIAPSSGR